MTERPAEETRQHSGASCKTSTTHSPSATVNRRAMCAWRRVRTRSKASVDLWKKLILQQAAATAFTAVYVRLGAHPVRRRLANVGLASGSATRHACTSPATLEGTPAAADQSRRRPMLMPGASPGLDGAIRSGRVSTTRVM